MFLNTASGGTGGAGSGAVGRFANISALSGADFPDDGRAVVPLDWDHDGDLDLWINNRSGPQLRLLRNDSSVANHFLAVRLVGEASNRDAIGARLELVFKEDGQQPLIRTLRAGDGFLGQGTKWVHFGLGDHSEIDRLAVHWPGGEREEFRTLSVDRRYVVTEGGGLSEWSAPNQATSLTSTELSAPTSTEVARVPLAERVRMPTLDVSTFDRQKVTIARWQQPVLVNLWASWCAPCMAELKAMSDQSAALEGAGLRVLALNVDTAEASAPSAAAVNVAKKLPGPFIWALPLPRQLDKLQLLHDLFLARHSILPLPSSFLIDHEGKLAVIYKGPVHTDQLLKDVSALSQVDRTVLMRQSAPLPGRWQTLPAPADPRDFAYVFRQSGFLVEAAHYYRDALAVRADDFVTVHNLADVLVRMNQLDEALAVYEAAVRQNPDHEDEYYHLGMVAFRLQQHDKAIRQFENALELAPDHFLAHMNIAQAYEGTGEGEKLVKHLKRAMEIRPHDVRPHDALGQFYHRNKQFELAFEQFTTALRLDPKSALSHNNLGFTFATTDKLEDAEKHFRTAIDLDSNLVQAHNNLGRLLMVRGDLPAAAARFREVLRIAPAFPDAQRYLRFVEKQLLRQQK